MLLSETSGDAFSQKQMFIWLITALIVAYGFRYAREAIAFILDQLYEFFIQKMID